MNSDTKAIIIGTGAGLLCFGAACAIAKLAYSGYPETAKFALDKVNDYGKGQTNNKDLHIISDVLTEIDKSVIDRVNNQRRW